MRAGEQRGRVRAQAELAGEDVGRQTARAHEKQGADFDVEEARDVSAEGELAGEVGAGASREQRGEQETHHDQEDDHCYLWQGNKVETAVDACDAVLVSRRCAV